jgi:hypothetical protein
MPGWHQLPIVPNRGQMSSSGSHSTTAEIHLRFSQHVLYKRHVLQHLIYSVVSMLYSVKLGTCLTVVVVFPCLCPADVWLCGGPAELLTAGVQHHGALAGEGLYYFIPALEPSAISGHIKGQYRAYIYIYICICIYICIYVYIYIKSRHLYP